RRWSWDTTVPWGCSSSWISWASTSGSRSRSTCTTRSKSRSSSRRRSCATRWRRGSWERRRERGFTTGGSACLPSADRGLPSPRSPPSRCAMGTSPVIVRPQPVRRPLPDASSARDAELAEGIRRGDEHALDRLLTQHWAPLVCYVAGRVGDVELAKDIAQEAFARLWERRHQIDPSRSVVAYLYQVVRRRAIDELRREAVRVRWVERERRQGPGASAADAQVRRLADYDVLVTLKRAIAGLPGRRREAFTLVHVQDLSYREAAEVMGIATQTVANQVAA